jgi:fermentation-respiration switch protein FrsA (DUF1100 family)
LSTTTPFTRVWHERCFVAVINPRVRVSAMATSVRVVRILGLALTTLVGASVAGCMALEAKERELVYRAVRDYVRTPADQGLAFENVWLPVPSSHGNGTERVHGWWLPAARADAPTLLYLHGTRFSLGNNLFRIVRFHRLGFNVLAIDYRGFGQSDGELPCETDIKADARAAWAELVRREGRPAQRYIYGHSLGAAVAIDLAANEEGVAGVIAESGFTSLADVVAERHLPLGPLMTQRFDALSQAPRIRAPVLFVHGTADSVVPATMTQRLFDAAPEPKRMLLIEGGNHSNSSDQGADDYRRAVADFVAVAQATSRERAVY